MQHEKSSAPIGSRPTAAPLWRAVAVAPLWLLSVGGEAEETIPASTSPDGTALSPEQPRMRRATRLRLRRGLRRGWNLIRVALLDQAPLPLGRGVPEPWPAVMAWEAPAPRRPPSEVPRAAGGRRRQEQQAHA